jgi:hypothetical protein
MNTAVIIDFPTLSETLTLPMTCHFSGQTFAHKTGGGSFSLHCSVFLHAYKYIAT